MKKTIFFFLFSPLVFSQVGINTNLPRATMEIVATNPTGNHTNNDGIIIPRITRERAQNMNPSESTIVYISEVITGSATGKTVNVLKKGFYYYDGSKWTTFNQNIFRNSVSLNNSNHITKLGGNLIESTIIDLKNHNLHFLSEPTGNTDHFKINNGTLSINTLKDYIGINTINPLANLHIKGDKTDNDITSKIKFEVLTDTRDEVVLNNKLTPLYVDAVGNIKNGLDSISGDNFYTKIFSSTINANNSKDIFTGITDSSIVTFKFNTNFAFAQGTSAIIFGEILFEKREGFKLISYAVSGINNIPGSPTITPNSIRIHTNYRSLEFNYADGIISVLKDGGSNTVTVFIDGKKLY